MSSRTIGPVEIAKLHSEIYRDLGRLVVAAFAPCVAGTYVGGMLFVLHYRPAVPPSRAAVEFAIGLLTSLPLHMVLAVLAGALLIGVSSRIGWRSVLARGGPVALVSLLLAAWGRCLHGVSVLGLVLFGNSSASMKRESEPMSPIVQQLWDSLVIAPAAPPSGHVPGRAVSPVSTYSISSRRSA